MSSQLNYWRQINGVYMNNDGLKLKQAQSGHLSRILDLDYDCGLHCGVEYYKEAIKLYKFIILLDGPEISGFIIYNIGDGISEILALAVRPGLNHKMVIDRLLPLTYAREDVEKVEVVVRESNLNFQLLFKELGFKWIQTLKAYFVDDDSGKAVEDGYRLQRICNENKN